MKKQIINLSIQVPDGLEIKDTYKVSTMIAERLHKRWNKNGPFNVRLIEPLPEIKPFTKGAIHPYQDLEEWVRDNEFYMYDNNKNVIGDNIIHLEHKTKSIKIVFILIGTVGNEYQYECAYSDLK